MTSEWMVKILLLKGRAFNGGRFIGNTHYDGEKFNDNGMNALDSNMWGIVGRGNFGYTRNNSSYGFVNRQEGRRGHGKNKVSFGGSRYYIFFLPKTF